jgi:hypothetical protein
VATLVAVILAIVGLDVTTKINCQVSAFTVDHTRPLTDHERKLWITFQLVSIPNDAFKYPMRPNILFHFSFFLLGLRLPGFCHRFTVNRASHVRHRLILRFLVFVA